jgi:hypothetical protein
LLPWEPGPVPRPRAWLEQVNAALTDAELEALRAGSGRRLFSAFDKAPNAQESFVRPSCRSFVPGTGVVSVPISRRVAVVLVWFAVTPAWGQAPADNPDAKPARGSWTVLFRSDDPSLWDRDAKDAQGQQIAIPLKFAPASFRYLRLRRMDTGEALILPLTPDQLQNGKPPKSDDGFWWNGSAKDEYKGRHLGIVQGPCYKFPAPNGMIAVMTTAGWEAYAGSGFGNKAFANDAQYYCWRGKEIPRTAFEIAVSDAPLTPEEKRSLVSAPAPDQAAADNPDAKPARGSWTVLFRSDDPSLWDRDAKDARGQQAAIPLRFAPASFRYLRLRRMDTGEALILPLTPDQLQNGKPPKSDDGFWWSGATLDAFKGYHLGIVQGPRRKFPEPTGLICVMFDGWDGFGGSGFGHKYGVGDAQYYCWRGKEIPRTAFEIAVSDAALTPEEDRKLLTRP